MTTTRTNDAAADAIAWAAERVEQSARAFASAAAALREACDAAAASAQVAEGSSSSAFAVTSAVGAERRNAEIAGMLVALGLGDLFQAHVARGAADLPVRDFAARWAERATAIKARASRSTTFTPEV